MDEFAAWLKTEEARKAIGWFSERGAILIVSTFEKIIVVTARGEKCQVKGTSIKGDYAEACREAAQRWIEKETAQCSTTQT